MFSETQSDLHAEYQLSVFNLTTTETQLETFVNLPVSNFIKIRSAVLEFLHADGRMTKWKGASFRISTVDASKNLNSKIVKTNIKCKT
jgi:hypothetical protein